MLLLGDTHDTHSSSGRPRTIALRDGSLVTLRPATSDDEASLHSFLSGLCPAARRHRFFSAAADTACAAHLVAATGPDRCGLVAHDEQGILVGHALCVQLDATRAEVAVEVADHLHGRGLATILIEQLAAVAEGRGVTSVVAEVMPDNREMLGVFRAGFDARVTLRNGTDAIEFPTAAWRLAAERFGEKV